MKKNKGLIIPDIIAVKDSKVVFFENKNRFVLEDFLKTNFLKDSTLYQEAIKALLKNYSYDSIFYGVGLLLTKRNRKQILDNCHLVDFAIIIDFDNEVQIVHQIESIF